MQTMPEFVDQCAEAFQLDIQGDLFEPTAMLCRQRVDQIEEMAPEYQPMLQQLTMLASMQPPPIAEPPTEGDPIADDGDMEGAPPDPAMMMAPPMSPVDMLAQEIVAQLQPPVEIEEPAHVVAVKYLRDMFLDDEIKEADELTRACLKALIRAHVQAMAQEAQIMSALAMMAQPQPPMEEQGGEGKGRKQGQPQRTDADNRKQQARANMSGGQIPRNPGSRPQPQTGAM
jgi:hypothetical protein